MNLKWVIAFRLFRVLELPEYIYAFSGSSLVSIVMNRLIRFRRVIALAKALTNYLLLNLKWVIALRLFRVLELPDYIYAFSGSYPCKHCYESAHPFLTSDCSN